MTLQFWRVFHQYLHFDTQNLTLQFSQCVDDLERPGRPSTSTDEQHVNQIKELVTASSKEVVHILRMSVRFFLGR